MQKPKTLQSIFLFQGPRGPQGSPGVPDDDRTLGGQQQTRGTLVALGLWGRRPFLLHACPMLSCTAQRVLVLAAE